MRMAWFGFLLVGALLAGQQVNPPGQPETYRSPSDEEDPVPVYTVEPTYTAEARVRRIEGTVQLVCDVTEEGMPEGITIVKILELRYVGLPYGLFRG